MSRHQQGETGQQWFNRDYATLHRRAMRYGKSARGALNWLQKTRTGSSRRAFRWNVDASGHDITVTLTLRKLYRDILRLA